MSVDDSINYLKNQSDLAVVWWWFNPICLIGSVVCCPVLPNVMYRLGDFKCTVIIFYGVLSQPMSDFYSCPSQIGLKLGFFLKNFQFWHFVWPFYALFPPQNLQNSWERKKNELCIKCWLKFRIYLTGIIYLLQNGLF